MVNLEEARGGFANIAGAYGAARGITSGNTLGVASGLSKAAQLGAKAGAFGGASSSIGAWAGEAGNALGIVGGLQRGGVAGYGQAAVDAGKLAVQTGVADSSLNAALGPAGAALAVYNFAENWQSGKTGNDAVSGAEAGAAIGSIVPGIGTVVGAVIGGAIGAISSAFGGGAVDPENANFDQMYQAYNKDPAHGQQIVNSIKDKYTALAGLFDLRGSQITGNIPIYNLYGRMGEQQFTRDMTGQINQALAKGTISLKSSPQQIMDQVVLPWINQTAITKGQNPNWTDPNTNAIKALMQGMVKDYMSGGQTNWNAVGGDNPFTDLPKVGALGIAQSGPAQQAQQQVAPFNQAVISSPLGSSPSATPSPAPAAKSSTPGTPSAASSSSTSTASSSSSMLPVMMAVSGLAGAFQMPAQMSGAGSLGNTITADQGMTPEGTQTTAAPDPNAGSGGDSGGGFLSSLESGLSALSSGFNSFSNSSLGQGLEFGALSAAGLSQANEQKKTNDQLAGSLSDMGKPFTTTGQGINAQLTGTGSVGGPLGSSINDQTAAAANLGRVAKDYSTGQLTGPQNQQVQDFVKQQRAMVDSQLAASGNTDSSARQAAYQQIDDNAAKLSQQLTQNNLSIAQAALTEVQQTYSNILNQSLSSAEFGFGAQSQAVAMQIQSDTQLSQSLNTLFGQIAQGFGSAMRGPATGGSAGSSGGSGVAGQVGNIAKSVAGSPSGGAKGGGSAGGSGGFNDFGGSGISPSQSNDMYNQLDSSTWLQEQATNTDIQTQLDQSLYTPDLSSIGSGYDTSSDPFGLSGYSGGSDPFSGSDFSP